MQTMENSAKKVLRQIEQQAKKEFLPIIGPQRGKILVDEIKKNMPDRVLEVGTLIGYSTILMGKNLDANAEIITIENHQQEAQTAAKNIKSSQIPPKVNIIVGDALKVIPHLEGCFDFAFIDASKQEYLSYLRLAERKFHEGTVVVADNAGSFAEQMNDYLSYVRNSGRYQSRFVSVGKDGLEISLKL